MCRPAKPSARCRSFRASRIPRSSSRLRDTELLRISRDGFDALIARHPRVMLNLMRIIVRRLQETTHRPTDGSRPKTFAIVPLQEGSAERADRAAHRRGPRRNGLESGGARFELGRPARRMVQHFRSRARHRVLSRRSARQSVDAICACVRPTASSCWRVRIMPLPLRPLDMPAFKERATGRPQLLLLHPEGRSQGLPDHFALQQRHLPVASSYPRRPARRHQAAGAVRFGPRRRTCAGGRRRARLRPYRRPQGAEGSGRSHRSTGRHQHGRDHRGRPRARMEHRGTDRPHARGLRRQQSAVRLHAAAHRARARTESVAICCARISAKSASRNCRSRSSASRPISPRAASMCIAPGPCGAHCGPAWRCRASFRPSPITAICSSMAA